MRKILLSTLLCSIVLSASTGFSCDQTKHNMANLKIDATVVNPNTAPAPAAP